MIVLMLMNTVKISKGGQISVPAAVRKRWGTSRVTLEDRGDELVLRPAPDDPITALHGAFAGLGLPSSDEMGRRAREEDVKIEDRWASRRADADRP